MKIAIIGAGASGMMAAIAAAKNGAQVTLIEKNDRVGKKILKQVGLFDVYRGDKIAEGKKQYALSFVLQDLEKTLTDNDVERIMSKLLSTFQNEFGATLR